MQGVWFRDSTRREATRLGLSGYAKNLENGDVEVLATGSVESLDALERWLHKGPPLARVSGVNRLSPVVAALAGQSGFTIG